MKTTVPPRTGRTYATHNNQKSISPTHHTGLYTNERPCTDNAHVEMTPSLSNPTLEPHALFCPIEKGTAPLTTAPPLRALFTQSTGPNTAKNETQKQQQLRNNNVMSGCARCTLSHSDARLLSPPKSRQPRTHRPAPPMSPSRPAQATGTCAATWRSRNPPPFQHFYAFLASSPQFMASYA